MLFNKAALMLLVGAVTITAALPAGTVNVVEKHDQDPAVKVDSDLSGRQNCGPR